MLKIISLLVCLCLLSLAQQPVVPAAAPTFADVEFGGGVWYNQAGHPRVNGDIFVDTHPANLPDGTYLMDWNDFLSQGKGIIMLVPTMGIKQHVVWFTPKIELFGLASGGIAVSTNVGGTGSNVTSAFGVGGGLNAQIGRGFGVMPLMRVVNAGGFNTLVGGLNLTWGSYPTAATLTERAQRRALKAANKARIEQLKRQ